MRTGDKQLDDLADAVLDGADVDWVEAESSAGAPARPIVRQLQLVASVTRVHRQLLSLPEPAALRGSASRRRAKAGICSH
jgi:hypothetical protein